MMRIALLLMLLTSACASSAPAPISYGGGARSEQRSAQQVPAVPRNEPAPPARAPAVEAEPDWADGEGTPLSAFAITPSREFDPANAPRTHRIGANETLYDVATRYQIPMLALIEQNGLEPPYAFAEGRVLDLPPSRYHVVRRGEALEDVARRYNVDARSLALFNRMDANARVRAGERIYLPAVASETAVSGAAPQAQAAPAGSGRFAWPLRGEVVERFGPQPGGTRLDGIEIAGREGASVMAAADGDVIYAGADIDGLGALVLVRHAENYVTAYGYNRRALVREGQRVRAGEAIAELGARPDGRARLMFQVRRGNEALDPAPLLEARR